jgi:hypothetical protein
MTYVTFAKQEGSSSLDGMVRAYDLRPLSKLPNAQLWFLRAAPIPRRRLLRGNSRRNSPLDRRTLLIFEIPLNGKLLDFLSAGTKTCSGVGSLPPWRWQA